MDILLLLLETLAYFLGMQIILNKLYTKSKHYIFQEILNLSLRGIILIVSFFLNNLVNIVFFCVTILDIISLRLTFQKFRIKTVLTTYALFYSVYTIISSVLTFLISEYFQLPILAFIGVISGTFLLILCLIIVNIKPTMLSHILIIPSNAKRVCTVSIISSAMITYLLLYANGLDSTAEWNRVSKLLIVIFIVVIGSVFPTIIANSINKVYYTRQAELLQRQIELQAKHYEEMAQNNFELHRFRHDYKNMLIAVQEMIHEGDTKGAVALLGKENSGLSSRDLQKFDTGNGIVDAILSEKQNLALSCHTQIQFEGAVPSVKFAPTDLCVIFGNTLDNAIEACEKIPLDDLPDERVIRISCRCAGGFFFIRISNPVKEDIAISHNIMKTSKQNKAEHGFGLYSLKQAISKYNGTMNLQCIDCVFTVNLELELP